MIASMDGCRNGWVIAMADSWPCDTPVRLLHASDFAGCLELTQSCVALMLDMPIGLPSDSERNCDSQARGRLSGASSSVFRTPPRATLEAPEPKEFQRIHHSIMGKGAGLPVWGIVPKLKEVDDIMTRDPALQNRVREYHPELAWRRLAGHSLRSKHTGPGLLQRISILHHHCPHWLGASSTLDLPKEINIDDVLDAVVGLSVAQGIVDRAAPPRRLPLGDPPIDERGLRMEIWY